ncbi:MAG: tetratricopeptide repeat protein [Bryobacter sp.]|nr:tetratricopeptide repeat protein [Bryobacter sp.]
MRTILLVLVASATSLFSQTDFAASKLAAQKALAQGEWKQARALLEPLAQQMPDEIEINYWLAQSYRKSGDLAKAEKTTQWLLDLRPDYPGGLWEAALLREEFGDLAGSVDLLNMVYHRTPQTDSKLRLQILEDLARVFAKQKNTKNEAIIRQEIARLKDKKS